MTQTIYPVPGEWKKTAHINAEIFEKLSQTRPKRARKILGGASAKN